MKKTAWILCLLVALATLFLFAFSYIGGRRGMHLTFLALPAQMAPFLISLVSLASLFAITLIALVKRRHRSGVLICAGLALVFFILPFAVKPGKVFQAGFRARITSQVTAEELREIAAAVNASLPENGQLPGPEKNSLWSEEYRDPWDELVQNTAIGQLDTSMVILKRPRSVEITWGGALAGHWGVAIDTGSEVKPGDIAPGIRTCVADD